jgi:hypothetical protein
VSGIRPKHVRVALLLALLAVVVFYALHDVMRRRERAEWKRTLDVALVFVTDGSADAAALADVRRRVPALATRLREQFQRYRPDAPAPFAFTVYGPIARGVPQPEARADGWVGAVRHAFALWRFTRDVDTRAGVHTRGFDARLYVLVRPPSHRALVEGMSEHGGRVGVALTELDAASVDLALFVAAHELFHVLGASDRYAADGSTLFPDGLAEPDLVPQFPQRYAEVMARNRPLSASDEARPESLDELWVGTKTATEIGWVTP